MNLHAPQSIEAATELREIAAVPLQIVSPRESVPIVSVVQDTLVGANRFTRPNVLFTRREAMNLLVHAKRWNGILPPPVVTEPVPKWSGQQLMSALLPPVNLEMNNSSFGDADKGNPKSQNTIKIQNGQMLQGILDKSVFSKQLIHVLFNDYGPELTVDFLDSLQAMIANFLMNSGFSVGISDLIADEGTNQEISEALKKLTSSIEEQILQLHTGLFENASGRSNQEEFEAKVMSTLNKAVNEAGKIGLKSLADNNRMTNMVKAGSKGSETNVSQMIAVLGQQGIEGKRVPNGFQHRTLPHFKRFDDSAQARGFIKSSFIKGLQPDEFFFHAMAGREGLIDTAVKSVTGDTEIVVLENGEPKWTQIGPWIDSLIDTADPTDVEHHASANQELLNLKQSVYIPTCDADGVVTWGQMTAVTRHDPGECLYAVTTESGRSVTVAKSQSLIVWDEEKKQFLPKPSPDVKEGDFLPVTMDLCDPPVVLQSVDMSKYLPKTEYLYGTDYFAAKASIESAMEGRERCPAGWWEENNGKTFTLPYPNKGRFQRVLNGRTDMSNMKEGFIYPFSHCREHPLPDRFELNERNGIFVGLYLAEGNCDIPSGYVQITNNAPEVRQFVMDWFKDMGICYKERVREVTIPTTKGGTTKGTSSDVRGYSKPLGIFLDKFLGAGSAGKFVPNEAFTAPKEFVRGLLNGYFSGDGSVSGTAITAHSVSNRLLQGINMLCNRIGVFGKLSEKHTKQNNVGSENILPAYVIDIRSKWATQFNNNITLLDNKKAQRQREMHPTQEHCHYPSKNNVVLDRVQVIVETSTSSHEKLYDVTVPSTNNFILFCGLGVYDTADTGYMQRQIRVALEDLVTQHDGSVRDAMGNLLQIRYGEDGINATKLENQILPLAFMSDDEIRAMFDTGADAREESLVQEVMKDRDVLVRMFGNKLSKAIRYPVHIERITKSLANAFHLAERTDGSAPIVETTDVLDAQESVLQRTHADNRLWSALVRYYMAPKTLQEKQFTKAALDALVEQVVLTHWKSWVEPGQPVGVIAAQSIGEPATQLTLNSVDWDERIVIAKNGRILTTPIGEFIDNYYESVKDNPTRVQYLPNNQIYIELNDGHNWQAISCDENGKMMWTKLEAITRHPVVNEDGSNTILEVTLDSGRKVKATKGLSFLTLCDGKIVPTKGSDLRIGDALPLSTSLAIQDLTTELDLTNEESQEIDFAKEIPDWVLQASDSFVKRMMQKFFSINCNIEKDNIVMYSDSKHILNRLALLLTRYGIFGSINAANNAYTISGKYAQRFISSFNLSVSASFGESNDDVMEDVIFDKIVGIREVEPIKGWVYDVTVEKTRNFLLESTICQNDTFHHSGIAAKSNVTRGVPRLKELLKSTRNPKAVELNIYLRRDLRDKKEEARRVVQELEFTLLQDLVTSARIYYDPRDDATLISEDADWLAYMVAYEGTDAKAPNVPQIDPLSDATPAAVVPTFQSKKSPWILRFELDRERMYGKNITMDDIAYILRTKFTDATTVYTDYNSQQLIFRMRLSANTDNPLDDLITLKTVQNKVLTATAIRGIPGLRSVNYQKVSDFVELQNGKYTAVDQYVLTSDGSNFMDVLCHPDIDPTRLISSNVHDMYENLGIEATRAILFKEMSNVFEESGTSVNYRHVGILVDKICCKGKLMSIDRYGINKNDIGPLAKMSFEQTEDIALRAAIFGERDPALGVSANVMLGAPIRAGTAFTEIMFDEAAAIQLAKTTPEQTIKIRPSTAPAAMDESAMNDVLYTEETGDCAPALLRLDAALPPPPMETIQEEIPDVEIEYVEE